MRYLLLPLLVLVAGCQADQSLPIPQGKPLAPAQPSQAELQEIAWRTHAIELLRGEAGKDPHAHCASAPDLPGSRWPQGSAQGYCALFARPMFDLQAIAGSLENTGRRMRLHSELDTLLDRIVAERAREMELHRAFRVFDGSPAAGRVARQWQALEPESTYANTALGLHYLAAAVDARGTAYMHETPPAALAEMQRLAGKSKPHLLTAMSRDPRVTPACVASMRLGRYASDDDLVRRGLEVCMKWGPAGYAFVQEMQTHAEPRWGGSDTALAQVSDYARARQLANPALAALTGEPMLYHLTNPPGGFPVSPTPETAETTLDLALKVPNPYVLRFAADHQMMTGSLWAGIALLSQSVRLAPMEVHTRKMRGDYLVDADELELAERDIGWVLDHDPLDYLSNLKWERLQQRKQGQAPDYDEPSRRFEAKLTCHAQVVGGGKNAATCTQDLVDAWPEDPYAWFLRAEVLKGGDRRSERAALQRYLEIAPTNHRSHDVLVKRAKARLDRTR